MLKRLFGAKAVTSGSVVWIFFHLNFFHDLFFVGKKWCFVGSRKFYVFSLEVKMVFVRSGSGISSEIM